VNPSCLADVVSMKLSDLNTEYAPSTVPKIEHQIAHEANITVFNINRRSEPSDIFCDIVAEDNRSHRRLACARSAHKQNFALLLTLVRSRAHLDGDLSL